MKKCCWLLGLFVFLSQNHYNKKFQSLSVFQTGTKQLLQLSTKRVQHAAAVAAAAAKFSRSKDPSFVRSGKATTQKRWLESNLIQSAQQAWQLCHSAFLACRSWQWVTSSGVRRHWDRCSASVSRGASRGVRGHWPLAGAHFHNLCVMAVVSFDVIVQQWALPGKGLVDFRRGGCTGGTRGCGGGGRGVRVRSRAVQDELPGEKPCCERVWGRQEGRKRKCVLVGETTKPNQTMW